MKEKPPPPHKWESQLQCVICHPLCLCYGISPTCLISWRLLNMPSSQSISCHVFFINSESYFLNYLIMAYGHAYIFDKYFHLCLQQCVLLNTWSVYCTWWVFWRKKSLPVLRYTSLYTETYFLGCNAHAESWYHCFISMAHILLSLFHRILCIISSLDSICAPKYTTSQGAEGKSSQVVW